MLLKLSRKVRVSNGNVSIVVPYVCCISRVRTGNGGIICRILLLKGVDSTPFHSD